MSLGVTECFVFAKDLLITVSIILFVFDFFCHTIVYYCMSVIMCTSCRVTAEGLREGGGGAGAEELG